MSSLENLSQTNVWTGPYVHFQPLAIGGQDPALANANLIKQTILGPPFVWPWNRVETNGTACTAGTQDYTLSLPDFGFIEKAWIQFGSEVKEVTNQRTLSRDSAQERPQFISVQKDDGAGNLTFRLSPTPNKAYTLTICYQRKSYPLLSLGSRWDPIPDELGYLYKYGYLGLSMMITGDARFPIFNDRFISHLLGAQDGLDEMQRNIFLSNWLDVMKQVQRASSHTQQGTVSRGK
jgi:hypothetical protein